MGNLADWAEVRYHNFSFNCFGTRIVVDILEVEQFCKALLNTV